MNYSRQYNAILKVVEENPVHPDVEFIYNEVKKKLPSVGLATVYRNLNKMVNDGIIKKINGLGDVAHYDCNTYNHHHFICTLCGNVYDIDYDVMRNINKIIENSTGFEINSYDITFKGKCRNCKH